MLKRFGLYFVVAFLCWGHLVFAESAETACTYINIRPFLGFVRDQGNVGWCAQQAFADLLSYRFREELHGQQVSAMYLAMKQAKQLKIPFVDGTDEEEQKILLQAAQEQGLCTQVMEDRLAGDKNSFYEINELVSSWIAIKEKYQQEHQIPFDNEYLMKRPSFTSWFRKRRYRLAESEKTKDWVKLLEKLHQNDPILSKIPKMELMYVIQTTRSDNFLSSLADLICRGHLTFPKKRIEPMIVSAEREYSSNPIAVIDRELNRKNILSISILTDVKGLNETHKIVVVGRRFHQKKQRCEYYLRNSWGESCGEDYDEKRLFGRKCHGGYIWVSESLLSRIIFGLTIFFPVPHPSVSPKTHE